ncbi:hypothetical protein TRFO_25056 [Tritrichomonas foetus]|uniref:Uncharacterized protein n=1 Tax=Tritrichomonas foetus TaxID=1144522 RepID=A0A1J4K5Z1_9EUKA|nr:hypothetical protein TRFO_25056 [Tritrichomonas foetus]|eukprot:OHT06873.1 hypothetical protein TRFO_25056 [Tritrichomonas foetus]
MKKAKEQLQEVEKDTNSHSKEVASSADAMMNDIKAKNDNNQRKEITEATKEITEKTEALLGEFERRLKSMKATHNNESKRIKTEISRLFRGAVAKRKDELIALYKKAFSMKSEIGSIRKEYNNIIVQHQKNSRKLIENRANILNGIKRGCHDLKKQKENLALQEAKNAKTRQNDLNELNRLWKNMKASKNAEIEKLEQKIIEKRNQINKLEGRSTSNSKSRNSALNSITEGIIRDFEEEMQKKKTELEQLSKKSNE